MTPDPAGDIARRTELLASLPVWPLEQQIRFLVEFVDRVHGRSEGEPGAGEPVLNDVMIARLAHPLTDGPDRDSALALSVGPRAVAAKWVWLPGRRGIRSAFQRLPGWATAILVGPRFVPPQTQGRG